MKRVSLYIFLIIILLVITSCGSHKGKNTETSEADPIQQQYLIWITQKEKAVPQLREALKSDQWRMRSHALLAMGKTGDRSLIPLVMKALKEDEQRAVKNCAVTALGELSAEESVPYLISLLDGRDVSRRTVIEALGKIRSKKALLPLYKLFMGKNRAVARDAVKALIAIGDKKVSLMVLRDRKKIGKLSREVFAMMIVGELSVPGGANYCLEVLSLRAVEKKIAAVIALGHIGSRRGTRSLLPYISHHNRLLQKQTAQALVSIDDPGAVTPLVRNFTRKEGTAMASAYILSRMTVPSIPGKVFARFQQTSRVNGPGAYVLGRKKYKMAVPLLRKRLALPAEPGQRYLAEALGWLGDRESIPLLMKAARRKNIQGAVGAVWALGQLKAKEAVPMLCEMLGEDNRYLVPYIISSLGSIGDDRAVKPLVDYFYETRERYARNIGSSLGKMGGPDVIAFIKDNMSSGEKYRIMAAGSALVKLKDESLIPYGEELLSYKERTARKYAVLFLKRVTGLNYNKEEEWKLWFSKRK